MQVRNHPKTINVTELAVGNLLLVDYGRSVSMHARIIAVDPSDPKKQFKLREGWEDRDGQREFTRTLAQLLHYPTQPKITIFEYRVNTDEEALAFIKCYVDNIREQYEILSEDAKAVARTMLQM